MTDKLRVRVATFLVLYRLFRKGEWFETRRRSLNAAYRAAFRGESIRPDSLGKREDQS